MRAEKKQAEPKHDPQTGEVSPLIEDILVETERVQVDADTLAKLAGADIEQRIAVAQKHPRSYQLFIDELKMLATMDQDTAQKCMYAVPRGGKTVRGPSIRFAELAACAWGHIDVSSTIVHVAADAVVIRGVARDLQKNNTEGMDCRRLVQKKRSKDAADDDDINLAVAAGGSIARRNAILAVIPRTLWWTSYLAAGQAATGKGTMEQRRRNAIAKFVELVPESDKRGREAIPSRVFEALGIAGEEDIDLHRLQDLFGYFTAIRDGALTLDEALKPAAEREAEARRKVELEESDLEGKLGGQS